MKCFTKFFIGLFMLSPFLGTGTASAQVQPTRIMPLGNSITFGSGAPGGYRNRLYQLLTTAGYNVDFVGTQTGNGAASLPDSDHEGHGGWTIGQLDANIPTWFATIDDPDVVLLHIGTNDFGQNNDTTNAINRLDDLITKIALAKTNAHIIVSNLLERGEPQNTAIQTEFNPFVESRVNAQAAMGRKVSFLDIRAAVPLADMPDNLHPNQTGYDKMADAWLPAIQAVVQPEVDTFPPTLVSATGNMERDGVAIVFNEPVADSATNTTFYSISGGLTVLDAQLDPSQQIVRLSTTPQTEGVVYTITVNGVSDRVTPTPNVIASDSSIQFMGALPRGYENHVAESRAYSLVYSIDLPNGANYGTVPPPYTIDAHAGIGPFSRVAYYLELQKPGEALEYVWASMDPFTSDPGQIGIPSLSTDAIFQQAVTNLHVFSNVAGLDTGTNLLGNIEFWPYSYGGGNEAGIPAASGSFDFGDTRSPGGNYGSMQIHHTTAGQTALAFNRWGGAGGNFDLGIGNRPGTVDTDWTFAQNAGDYAIKTLQVLVYHGGDTNRPELVSADASFGRTFITVRFSEPLATGSLRAEYFALDHGVQVLGATAGADGNEVLLTTTLQPEGTALSLTVNKLRDASPCANPIADNSMIAVALAALPPEIAANIGASADGYELVATAHLPATGTFNTSNPYAYDDRAAPGTFSRIAYYLELQQPGGPVQYLWTSMDAFTINKDKIAIPTFGSGAVFQQDVDKLDVLSNVAGIVNGTDLAGGNIEFWPHNYAVANALGVPNASDTVLDFGDTRSGAGNHGSMQIHNHATDAQQTLFAMNNWGGDGRPIALGIGNRPTSHPDWTFADNAGTYTRKVLHVLVLPAPPAAIPPMEVAANVPDATNYQHVASLDIPASGNATSPTYLNDIRADVGPFSRVAYYLELTTGSETNWIWTAMDAFTSDALQIGLPTVASGAIFQQPVANLDVLSNVAGITNGTGLAGGNIEFWPSNYSPANAAGVPNASDGTYDFGDSRSDEGSYGSMQVHNHLAQQTLFAFNRWGAGRPANNPFGLGIGNRPTSHPDWTFADNGASYSNRVLHIFVLPGYASSTNAPTIVSATPSSGRNRLVLRFSQALADTAAQPANVTIAGLTVTDAVLAENQRDVLLYTSPQVAGATYTVEVSGVQDRSILGNLIDPGAAINFTAFEAPALFAAVPEIAEYELIYQLPIPVAARFNTMAVPYSIDESQFPQFTPYDRTAYLLELETAVTSQWVYVSADAFTPLVAQMGVPTLASGAIFQENLANMNVTSSPGSGITNGTGISTGNIEFWPTNYSAPNAGNVPGTTNTVVFDWGDTRAGGGAYGSMQIHNHGALQTLFAYNNWGGNGGNGALGIGNDPAPVNNGLDWTFHQNANTYTVKNLHVFARPGGAVSGIAATILAHPLSHVVNAGQHACFAVNVLGTEPYAYQWYLDGIAVPGATTSWLTLPAVSAADEGDYSVVITSVGGASITSRPGTLLVTGMNHAPTFAGYRITAQRDTMKSFTQSSLLLKADDSDLDPVGLFSLDPVSAQSGSVLTNQLNLVYTPANGYVGDDSFSVVLTDGQGGSVTGLVEVTVTTVRIPTLQDAAIDVQSGGETSVLFLGNPGQTYEIQRASSLRISDWQTIQVLVAGDDGILLFTDPAPPSVHAVYRSKTTAP